MSTVRSSTAKERRSRNIESRWCRIGGHNWEGFLKVGFVETRFTRAHPSGLRSIPVLASVRSESFLIVRFSGRLFDSRCNSPAINATGNRSPEGPTSTVLLSSAFRRGLATNLHRFGVADKVIQAVLRHSNVAVTQACYIKTAGADAIEAMRSLEDAAMQTNHKHVPNSRFNAARHVAHRRKRGIISPYAEAS